MPKTSSADQATYAVLKIVNALRNPSPESPFVTFGYAQPSVLHQLSIFFQTTAPVCLMLASPTPQMTIKLPKVPLMLPQQEPAWAHPRVLSPPDVHTIPPEPVTPPSV